MTPRVDRIEDHSFLASALDQHSVVVDLGMCRGRFSSSIARRFGCRVFGAEPEPGLFRALPAVAGLSARHVALTGKDGTVWLYTNRSGDPTVSPGLARDHSAKIEVPGVTLESFLAEAGLTHVDLLKIDIEGAEIPMLMNASEHILRNIEQMTVEFHDFIDPSQRAGVRAVDRRLRAAGFRRIRFSRDNTDVLYLNRRGRGLGRPSVLPNLLWSKYRMGVGRIRRRKTAQKAR